MLALLLLLPCLALPHWAPLPAPAPALLSGRFLPRPMPGQTQMEAAYMAVWGVTEEGEMDDDMDSAPLELSVSEDGTTLNIDWNDGAWVVALKFGEETTLSNPFIGKDQMSRAWLVAGNRINIETRVEEDGLMELKTFTFSPVGLQVRGSECSAARLSVQISSWVSKPAAWTGASMEEWLQRVDEEGEPRTLVPGWV